MLSFLTLFLAFQASAYAQTTQQPIKLDGALVTGAVDGTLIKYLGIPFAKAPRFNLPQPITSYTGNINASTYGPDCIQQNQNLPESVQFAPTPESEDCLSINVIKPAAANSTANSKLPVIVWIFGGGFQIGGASQPFYDAIAKQVVLRSIDLEKPVIYVTLNYRLSAYGFLASQEVANEGISNFGLHDQRVALHWVKRHIEAFGGDSSKITLWAQSAGSTSVALQMMAYGGRSDNLFHGAFMQSGAPLPVGPIQNGQQYYDALVAETNCTFSIYLNSLECLRHLPLEDLRKAVDKSPTISSYKTLNLPWLPRVDGDFIQDEPYKLVAQGKIIDIPTVSGTCDDEGTLFSEGLTNITTDADFKDYIHTVWAPDATDDELSPLWTLYTSVPSEGSPYGQPNDNQPFKQYNRLAAFQGDIYFQGPRRLLSKALARKTQKAWVYLSKRLKTLEPLIGSSHGTDLFKSNFTQIYVVNFANNFDPNIGDGIVWPPYTTTTGSESPQILTFLDPQEAVVARDDYRTEAIDYVSKLALNNPL